MELKTAIEILEYHQEWRLGKREDMIHEPKMLTLALDMVLDAVKKISSTAVIESITDYSCPNCGAICSDTTLISQTCSKLEEYPSQHYIWDEFHKCQNCETLYLLHNGT